MTPPPPPHYRVLSTPSPPPQGKKVPRKKQTPRLETNCTPVVDNVCDNFNLILILVV